MNGSDSEEDITVRFGTQLEPYEEDRTCTMAKKKSKKSGAVQRRYRQLLAANVDPVKARKMSLLTWLEICKEMPSIIPNLPKNFSTDQAKVKTTSGPSKLRVRNETQTTNCLPNEFKSNLSFLRGQPNMAQKTLPEGRASLNYWEVAGPSQVVDRDKNEHRPNECEPNQGSIWYHPFMAQHTTIGGGTYLNYWAAAGPSQIIGSNVTNPTERLYTENDSNEKSVKEQPYRVTKAPAVGSVDLNYSEATEPLQVKVQNGNRAVKCLRNESDGSSFWGQPSKARRTSQVLQLDYEEIDRPSRNGLRNQTHPKRKDGDIESAEENSCDQPYKAQKTSLEDDQYINHWESNRPSRLGLRKETQHMENVSTEFHEEYHNWNQYYWAPNTSSKSDSRLNYREKAVASPDRNEKKDLPSEIDWDEDQSMETLNAFTATDAKLNVNSTAGPIRVGIRNITPMTEEQMDLIHQCIINEIVKIGVQGIGPKFLGSKHRNGWVLFLCENIESRTWLEKEIPKLKPWPEASLSAIRENQLPKSFFATVLIPYKEDVTVPTALKLLRVQNPGLETERWKVYKCKDNIKNGLVVHLGLDAGSVKVLRLQNLNASLGTSTVTFRIKSKNKKNRAPSSIKSGKSQKSATSNQGPSKNSHKVNSKKKNTIVYDLPSSTPNFEQQIESSTFGKKASLKSPLDKSERSNGFTWVPQSTTKTEGSKPGDSLTSNPDTKRPSNKWRPKAGHLESTPHNSPSDWLPW